MEVRPATPEHWDDVFRVFGRRGDDPSWCWCHRFLAPDDGGLDNREALRREILGAAVPPGVLAYVDGHPVGWSRVAVRDALPGVRGNRALARVLVEDPGVWWVACFAVDARHRRSGVGAALLAGAVDLAHAHGATAVEGHPVDVAALSASGVGGSAIFTGTVAMFAAAGFTEVARTSPSRPVMRRVL